MKKFFFILFLVSTFFLHAQTSITVGDNIKSFAKKIKPEQEVKSSELMKIPEGKLQLLAKNDETDNFIFLKMNDKNFVGVFDTTNGEYFFDTNGDAILDVLSYFPIVPYWVVTESKKLTIDKKKDNVKFYLENFYKCFNSSENPYTSNKKALELTRLYAMVVTETAENRDVLLALFNYYAYAGMNVGLDIMNLYAFDEIYKKRFSVSESHPIIVLHLLESFLNYGDYDTAKGILDTNLERCKDLIPMKVYSWQLENDEKLKSEKYAELKEKHPEHWIVKQI